MYRVSKHPPPKIYPPLTKYQRRKIDGYCRALERGKLKEYHDRREERNGVDKG